MAHGFEENTPDWRAAGFHGDVTMAQTFIAHAQAAPDRPILFWSKDRVDEIGIGEVHARALKIASALQALGIGAGDVVGLQVANNLDGALAFQAVMLLGAIVLPIVHIYGPAETSYVLRQTKAKAYVVPDRMGKIDFLSQLDRLEDLPDLKHTIVIGETVPEGALRWKDLPAMATDAPIRGAAGPDDVILVLYTSGTTAAPKGVQHSANSLLAEVNGTIIRDDGSGKSTLSAWPLGHAAGIFAFLKGHMGGIPTVLMDRWDAAAAGRLIEERRVSASGGAPVMLSDLLEFADAGHADITSMRNYQCGAASVPDALMEHAERYGIFPYRSYGSSEHPSITRGSPDDSQAKRIGTDGKPSPGNEVRILDDNEQDVPVGVEGEIVSRGPEMFLGYRDTSLNAAAYLPGPGGWYRTGDIGRLDADGYLTITDRKKDIIIRGGENISSKEVEDLLVRHPAILEAAVVAAPHPRLGEQVAAYVLLRPGFAVDLAVVQAHFTEMGVARQKTPERLEVLEEFPRTAAGKIKKFELRDRLR